jgi:5-methyltetrahydrofolate--homocysteine methyltransferase
VRGLLDGGVDILLIETIFDTLNAKAAIVAIAEVFASAGTALPLMISVTITDKSGAHALGQTIEAFWTSMRTRSRFSVGINCALGAREMRPYVRSSRASRPPRVCYPNAGLPNAFGEYDEAPGDGGAARRVRDEGWSTSSAAAAARRPSTSAAIAERGAVPPRAVRRPERTLARFSGLEPLTIARDSNFVMIGERTNVTGSALRAS